MPGSKTEAHVSYKEWPQPFPYQDCIPPPLPQPISDTELGPLSRLVRDDHGHRSDGPGRKRHCSFISSSPQRQNMKDHSSQRGYEL